MLKLILSILSLLKKESGVILYIIIVAAILGFGSEYFLGPDNPVEQEAEEVIRDQTGVEIDLSP